MPYKRGISVKISEIIWLENIVEKLAWKHHVRQYEVIEVLQRTPKFRLIEKGHRQGEHVYSASGQTEAGRYLIIFFVYKRNKQALVVSARDMSNAERKRYESK
jgi:uncharacterized DUF497 family protein